jgi:glutaminyl-tRNA synthetase
VRATVRPGDARRPAPDGRKAEATIHWVSARHAVDAEVRLYEVPFTART